MAENEPVTRLTHPMIDPIVATRMQKGKIVTAEEAVDLIRDGDTVVTAGFVGAGFAEEIAIALKERFLRAGTQRDLTLTYPAGQGDGKTKGLNHLALEGLVGRIICGHPGLRRRSENWSTPTRSSPITCPWGPCASSSETSPPANRAT